MATRFLRLPLLAIAICSLARSQPINPYTAITIPPLAAGQSINSYIFYNAAGASSPGLWSGGANALVVDTAGNLYIAAADSHRVVKVTPEGGTSVVAGTGIQGYNGDNQPATSARLSSPTALAIDAAGNLYIAEYRNHRVRKVTPTGTITTVAGTGEEGTAGDGGPAVRAQLIAPHGLAFDSAGNLYILVNRGWSRSDPTIRKVSAAGVISSLQDAPAEFGDIAVDSAGNLYLVPSSSFSDSRIYRRSAAGVWSVLAGTSTRGFNGDDQPATSALLDSPTSVAVDASGAFYIADQGNNRVRKVLPNGMITTIAGTGQTSGQAQDGNPATLCALRSPGIVAVDLIGNVYVAYDYSLRQIARLSPVQIFPQGVVNAASYATGPVAPGEIVSIFGSALATQLVPLKLDSSGRVATVLGDTKVFFDDVQAPLIFVYPSQVSAVVPYVIAGKPTIQVRVEYKGLGTNLITLPTTTASPGIFTLDASGKGQGAILNEDGRVNSPSNPAARGSIIVLYATGEGQTDPPGVDGKVATGVLPKPLLPVSVRIGGMPAEILYVGAAPGLLAGVLQVNARVPAELATTGAVPISLTLGTATSAPGVTVSIR